MFGTIFQEAAEAAAKAESEAAAKSEQVESEWSEDDDEENAASEPLLNDRESTGYTTDDGLLENVSMLNEAGLTDAEGAFFSLKLHLVFKQKLDYLKICKFTTVFYSFWLLVYFHWFQHKWKAKILIT